MAKQKFDVLRQHLGDKMYMPGDVREADNSDVAHLVESGVLRRKDAGAAPKNKAETTAKNKGK